MSLEEEAERQRAGPPPEKRTTVRMPKAWDRLFRVVALIILIGVIFASLYVPVWLIPYPWGVMAVLAPMVLGLVAIGGRLHELRVRVDTLEERLDNLRVGGDEGAEPPPGPPQEG